MPSALLSTGLKIGGSLLANKLGGGKKTPTAAQGAQGVLTPFTGGGVNFGFGEGGVPQAVSDPNRRALIESLTSSLRQQGSDIRGIFAPQFGAAFDQGIGGIQGLLDQVSPGFGALTEARTGRLRTEGERARSDLRSNLARRRVLGSSFAQDIQNRQEQELSRNIAEAEAQSFLEELDLSNKLINQRTALSLDKAKTALDTANLAFSAEQAATQAEIDEQNLLLQTVTQVVSQATSQIGANQRLATQMNAQSAQGVGSLFGGLAKPVGDFIGDKIGGIFGGGSSGPTSEELLAFS